MAWERVKHSLRGIMLFLFALLCLLALVAGLTLDDGALVFAAALVLALFLALCPKPEACLGRLGKKRTVTALIVLCALVKGAWVFAVRLAPQGDYYVFWEYANEIANYDVIYGGRYAALFSHVPGYSFFLSKVLRVFGRGELVVPLLNVLLTLLMGALLFRLCRDESRGAAALFLWTLCPSQTVYNAMVLPEPLYTTLLLAFFLLVLLVWERVVPWGAMALLGAVGGGLLAWFNALRPIAPVPVLALLIWLVLWAGRGRDFRRRWLAFVLGLLAVYWTVGQLWNDYFFVLMGEAPCSTPGYSLLVGLNEATGGTWNQADADLLFSYAYAPGATAQSAQEAMLRLAGERLATVDLPSLLWRKFITFIGSDTACLIYLGQTVHPRRAAFVCNLFYDVFLLLSLRGAWRLWREKRDGPELLLPLYALGLTLAQLLVEVAGRYHYSLIPVFILTAQYGLFRERETDKLAVKKGT